MSDFSILIGGKAGFGIDSSSLIIGNILNQLGYRLYIYRDYPSLIRGGHTFSIIRASQKKIYAHQEKVDFLLALNQETIDFHKERLKNASIVIYDSDAASFTYPGGSLQTKGVAFTKIVKQENAPEIMRNSAIIGSFTKAIGLKWQEVEQIFRKNISKEVELNLKIARYGYEATEELSKIQPVEQNPLPLLTGNEGLSLGLLRGGLKTYVAYPMTPSSGILHFLASLAEEFSLKVIHPESEIAVILMALGFSALGERVAVASSGGGFCLMTEGLSLSGMAELPVTIIVGQRPGPSTGLPTYTAQTELLFVLNAGQGEFPRFVVAPGDPQEAYFWGAISLNLANKYQIPAIIVTDKTLSEGTYSFNLEEIVNIKDEPYPVWDRGSPYKRYVDTETGVSALTFIPDKDAVVKINSYEHDEYGITTEEPSLTKKMQDKRLRKEKYLMIDLEGYNTVGVYGRRDCDTALLCWGSNKGVCIELAEILNLKVIQPIVLWPFPEKEFSKAMEGVKKIIAVENNASAQLATHISRFGYKVDKKVLKYDGRPFSIDELEARLKEE